MPRLTPTPPEKPLACLSLFLAPHKTGQRLTDASRCFSLLYEHRNTVEVWQGLAGIIRRRWGTHPAWRLVAKSTLTAPGHLRNVTTAVFVQSKCSLGLVPFFFFLPCAYCGDSRRLLWLLVPCGCHECLLATEQGFPPLNWRVSEQRKRVDFGD